MNPSIFKAYDIRGVYPEEITKDDAYKIGFAVVRFLKAKNIVIGEDSRTSSPVLRGAIVDAVTKAGCNVYYIGQCTTPLFYYSVSKLNVDGGIMVTASHNPPQYGGVKIIRSPSRPIGLSTGLEEVKKMCLENIEMAKEWGTIQEKNFINDYVDFVIRSSKLDLKKSGKLKIVIDSSNGMTPLVIAPLLDKLKLNATKIHFEIDGGFPGHSPDVSREENLNDLKNKVKEIRADVGFAFDGDGDRISMVDENGNRVRSDFILALLFKYRSSFFWKPKTIFDLRYSKAVRELLGSNGIISKVGYISVKKLMRDNGADLGGELSGHFMYKELEYSESVVLTMLYLVDIISRNKKPLSELVKEFEKYHNSREINTEIEDIKKIPEIIERLKVKYKDGQADFLDGITVTYPNWWFNVRPSNTESALRLVVEADTEILMREKVAEITKEIRRPY